MYYVGFKQGVTDGGRKIYSPFLNRKLFILQDGKLLLSSLKTYCEPPTTPPHFLRFYLKVPRCAVVGLGY